MVTAAVGCTATLVEALLRRRGGAAIAPEQRYPVARLVTTIAACLVWLPLAWLVFDTLGLDGLAVFGLCAVQPIACWLGVVSERRMARRIAAGAAALAGIALAVAIVLPRYSTTAPQRLGVSRVHDLTTDRAWFTMRYDGPPPAVIPSELVDDATREQLLPWDRTALAAPAPVTPIAAPALAVVSEAPLATGRRIVGTLVSRRGASAIRVGFPPGTTVTTMRIGGELVTPARVNDWQLVTYVGLPPGGIDVTIELAGTAPIKIRLVDQSPAGLLSSGSDSRFAVPGDDVVPSGDDEVVIAEQTL
jgi:hypothetical protein